MASNPLITDYITPPPPFMAGTNALDKAISDIWTKRQNDEQNRINAAQQVAQQELWEGGNRLRGVEAAENTRHHMADETYNMGTLQKDRSKQQMEYIAKVAEAFNTGNPEVGMALAGNGHLFGLPPQVMSAVVAQAKTNAAAGAAAGGDVGGGGDAGGAFYDLGANGPSEEATAPAQAPIKPPAEEPVAPPVDTAAAPPAATPLPQAAPAVTAQGPAAPVQPQGTAPVPPQAELNTPKPPTPPQPAGDPSGPPATPPMPPPPAPPPQAAAPGQGGQVRRDDIHIQPRPPSQLGVPTPVAPGTPAQLPAMPYAGDPKRHPIAREADPNWEGRVPTQFPGGAPQATGTPETGPLGAGSGGIDQATRMRWAARGQLPNGQQIMAGNAQRVHDSLEATLMGSARGETEQQFARSAIAAGTAAASVMSPEKAYDAAVKRYENDVTQYRKDLRNTESAGASKAKFDSREERQRANDFVAQQTRMVNQPEFKLARERYANLKEMEDLQRQPELISDTNPNAHLWTASLFKFLEIMGNKGVVTDKDTVSATGMSASSWVAQITARIKQGLRGGGGDLQDSMAEAIQVMAPILRRRGRGDYVALMHRLDAAPSPYAREQAQALLDAEYEKFDLSDYPKEEAEAKPRKTPKTETKPKLKPGDKETKEAVDDVVKGLGGTSR